jgi:signal transduction histidine kinase
MLAPISLREFLTALTERFVSMQFVKHGRFIHIRILSTVVIAFLVASFACSIALAAEPKRVMLLHSFGREFKPWSEYAREIRTQLVQQSPWALDITEHSLVSARSSNQDPEVPFVQYLGALFSEHPLDLIVSIGAPAAAFVQRHRHELFTNTPMVFTAVDQRRVQPSLLSDNDSVVAVRIDYLAALENVLRVLPDTKNVTVVVGASPIEKFWKDEIAKEAEPLTNRVTLSWTDHLSFEELLKHAAGLPSQSAIFWELMIVDAAGVVHDGNTALARLHKVANAPIFSYDESFFGGEIVGGPLLLVDDTSRQTAAVAIRILGGEKAGAIKTPPVQFAMPRFDWREMQRWRISESRLPPGSEIYFRSPTLWEAYRAYILVIIAAFVIQSALIAWLIYEHRRRQLAEAGSLELTHELARMNRFATAGELSASIAHELRQPLTAVAASGAAGLNWLKRLKEESPDVDQVRSALQNVVSAGHRADDVIKSIRAMFKNEPPKRTKVNVNDLIQQVTLITAGSIKSNSIVLDVNLTDHPPPLVMGDPIQLQQVILNLVMNAVEAMSHSGHWARMVLLTTQVRNDGTILMRVVDSGPSVDPKVAEKMFEPFFTTKPGGMGMGLAICKTIIEAHGGSLTAFPNTPQGMEFQIVLPRYRHE